MKDNLAKYSAEVIAAGDEASGNFKGACDEANRQTSISHLFDDTNGYELKQGFAAKESIDGVGTKLHIYTDAFEKYITEFEAGKITEDELFEICVDIWARALSDLIAMNTDDLRDGEMAVAVTNIIDINHLMGLRGKVFADTMAAAMKQVILENDIPMTAGETAVLGEPKKVEQLMNLVNSLVSGLEGNIDLATPEGQITNFHASQLISDTKKSLAHIMQEIDFNIGGTSLGISIGENKLIELKPGQKVGVFFERPHNGIIGPRSNGLTAIRKVMKQLAGPNWAKMSFEDFLSHIGVLADKIPEDLKQICAGKDMWEIATGKTTVFNPFVSRDLLGGYEGDPIVGISSIIHVTGNPGRKITEGLKGDDRLRANLDISKATVPHIIQIIQHLGFASDEKALGSLNMGVPYAIVYETEDEENIRAKAQEKGYDFECIGKIEEGENTFITGVGIGNSTIEIEPDRDVPNLPDRYENIHSGKVRETYANPDNPDEMILVATDRISTHDVIHSSLVPGKGAALTQISNYWFKQLAEDPRTADIKTQFSDAPWPEDFPDELKQKSVIVKKLKALPIEAIVRGYLYGSALKGYDPDTGKLATGQFVGKGLKKCSAFETPQFTPSTKSDGGDVNIDAANMHIYLREWLDENGYEHINEHTLAEQVKELSLRIYAFGCEKAGEKGDVLGDTKFEFALDKDGNLVLIDEIMTPDSSRFWKKLTLQEGEEPESSDKQPVRDYVSEIWKGKPRSDKKKYPITLPNTVIGHTSENYGGMSVKYAA